MEKEAIISALQKFAHSFDNKDWKQMKTCLHNEIWIDYSSFRNTKPTFISRAKYIYQRKIGLKNLRTKHLLKNFRIQRNQGQVNCSCHFVIKRFKGETNAYYHSYGAYNFNLTLFDGRWKITKIVQTISRNEGDESIHGAFK